MEILGPPTANWRCVASRQLALRPQAPAAASWPCGPPTGKVDTCAFFPTAMSSGPPTGIALRPPTGITLRPPTGITLRPPTGKVDTCAFLRPQAPAAANWHSVASTNWQSRHLCFFSHGHVQRPTNWHSVASTNWQSRHLCFFFPTAMSAGRQLAKTHPQGFHPRRRAAPAPLQAPGAAGPVDGEVLTNKSSQGRADAQRLVATRLLDRLHDPLGHFSRLQRIYPRAR